MKSESIEHTYVYTKPHLVENDKIDYEIALVRIESKDGELYASFSGGRVFKLLPIDKRVITELIDCTRCGNVFEMDVKDIYDAKDKYRGRWFCDECSKVIEERERIKNNHFGNGYIGMPVVNYSLRK